MLLLPSTAAINACVDPLVAAAKSIEADLKTLSSNLSRPPLPLSSGVQREFIESKLQKCEAMAKDIDAIETFLASESAAVDAIDEVRRLASLVKGKAAAVQQHFAKYGFVPDPAYDLTADWEPSVTATTAGAAPSIGGLVTSFVAENAEDEDDVDPPSPTLESFGISSLTLGILNSDHLMDDDYGDHSSPRTPISTRTYTRMNRPSVASSGTYSSPSLPHIASSVKSRQSDPNSIFGQLIRHVNDEEFATLPEFVTAQLSVTSLNEAISDINEYVTDKRFSSMDSDEDTESVTLEELSRVDGLEQTKIKAVLVALLQLDRMTSSDDGQGSKRYHL